MRRRYSPRNLGLSGPYHLEALASTFTRCTNTANALKHQFKLQFVGWQAVVPSEYTDQCEIGIGVLLTAVRVARWATRVTRALPAKADLVAAKEAIFAVKVIQVEAARSHKVKHLLAALNVFGAAGLPLARGAGGDQ